MTLAGPISGAAVVEVAVRPGAHPALYRVALLQVAADDDALDDAEDYGAAIGR